MSLPIYEDLEVEFLEAMATRFGFDPKVRFVFLQRFLEVNAEKDDWKLAQDLGEKLIVRADGTTSKNPDTVLRDRLKVVYQKLEAEGCDYGEVSRRRWKIAKPWLREVVFPEWVQQRQSLLQPPLSIEQLWEQLQQQATRTDKMGPVLVQRTVTTLGMTRRQSAYRTTVPINSDIQFEVNIDTAGHLLLLEREPSGIVCCLCPSEYAPEPKRPAGVTVLPQEKSSEKYFTVNELGREQMLAIISKTMPTLDWLHQGSEEVLELGASHLKELLEYLNRNRDCQLLRMEYTVTA